MLEHILLIVAAFAATTAFYIILYWRIISKMQEPRAAETVKLESDEVEKLRDSLSVGEADLKLLLAELKKIREEAELLLDEGGDLEGEGGGDKGGAERG